MIARGTPAGRAPLALLLAALAASIGAIYWPVLGFPFLSYDDQLYVAQNPAVAGGLSRAGLRWAFTSVAYAFNWHPLTWLSHQADVQLFGMNAGLHHATSLALHVASSLLLLLVLRRMTGTLWRSALAAALFAVHPLRLESVAWVAERKDVLAVFFLVLTLAAYRRYVGSPGLRRYLEVTAALALGLLAKPTLVTLPCALLLLDLWPFGRWQPGAPPGGGRAVPARLVAEKIPWLALAGASSAVTLAAQQRGGIFMAGAADHLPVRLAVAAEAPLRYLALTVWPHPLSVLHPFPGAAPSAWQSLGAAIALASAVAAAAWAFRRLPFLLVGWLWFLGTLVPMLGLVKVGAHSIAERYTYVPHIGLFVAAVWGCERAAARLGPRGPRLAAAAALGLAALAGAAARHDLAAWAGSRQLFEAALAAYPESRWLRAQLEFNLGQQMSEAGRPEQAAAHFREGLRLVPDDDVANYLLGKSLLEAGRGAEAAPYLQAAVRLNPRSANYHWKLGQALAIQGRTDEALAVLRRAVRAIPDSALLQRLLGALLLDAGRADEASAALAESLRLSPGDEATQRLLEEARRGRLPAPGKAPSH